MRIAANKSGRAQRANQVEHAEDFRAIPHHLAVASLPPAQHTVTIDDEGRPVRDVALSVEHAILADHLAVDVAEQRERKLPHVSERLVTEGTVAGDRQDGRLALADPLGDLSQAAQFGGSDAPEVVTVEDQDNVATTVLGERDLSPIGGRQAEARRGGGEPDVEHGPIQGSALLPEGQPNGASIPAL